MDSPDASMQFIRAIRFNDAVLRGFRAAVAIGFTGERRTLFLQAIIPSFSRWVRLKGKRSRKNSLPFVVYLTAMSERVEKNIARFNLTVEQISTVLWILCEEIFASQPPPVTKSDPGTPGKVAVMESRAKSQYDLFANGDRQGLDWITRFCGIKPKKRAENGLQMDAEEFGKGGMGQNIEQEAKWASR